MAKEEICSKIVVFKKYNVKQGKEFLSPSQGFRTVTIIEADFRSGYELVEPSKEMFRTLSIIKNKEDILKFCYKYGLPFGKKLGAEEPRHPTEKREHSVDCFALLEVFDTNKNFSLGHDIIIKSTTLEDIQCELSSFQFALSVARILKKYPCLTTGEDKIFNKAIEESRRIDAFNGVVKKLSDEEMVWNFLAEEIEFYLTKYTKRCLFVEDGKIKSCLIAENPLACAWIMLYDIFEKGQSLNECIYCNAYFSPTHKDAFFCPGTTCNHTYGTRIRRAKKEIISRINNGESIDFIARALNFNEKYLSHIFDKWKNEAEHKNKRQP